MFSTYLPTPPYILTSNIIILKKKKTFYFKVQNPYLVTKNFFFTTNLMV